MSGLMSQLCNNSVFYSDNIYNDIQTIRIMKIVLMYIFGVITYQFIPYPHTPPKPFVALTKSKKYIPP